MEMEDDREVKEDVYGRPAREDAEAIEGDM